MPAAITRLLVENLHGFSNAQLSLDRARTVIVGPNNSGKTAALTLVDWLLNRAQDAELEGRELRKESRDVLMPARETGRKARRLNLYVREGEGKPEQRLRFRVLTTGGTRGVLRLGAPRRSEPFEADPAALALLTRIREELRFVHIPSFRDAQSDRFASTLRSAYRSRLEERALHAGRGRARQENKQLKRALDTLRGLTDQLVSPLWDEIKGELPAGLARTGRFEFTAAPEEVLEWIVGALEFRLTTDDHDALGVGVNHVGAGLQSLLDLAVNTSGAADADVPLYFAVEEPEAFLHPAAQRTLARRLLGDSSNARVIVTTHSPLVVDETRAGDVVVAKRHKFYEPPRELDTIEVQKRSATMTSQGAEAMFSHGVLLVEGDGDRQFFEALRRRLAASDEEGHLDRLHVVAVGSKDFFAPWIRLFNGYGRSDDRPIPWLAVPDADAGTSVLAAFRETRVAVPTEVRTSVEAVNTALGQDDVNAWRTHASAANRYSEREGLPLRFLVVDLEEAMLNDASETTWKSVADGAGVESDSLGRLMSRLGSKALGPRPNAPQKAPWVRGLIGRTIPLHELTPNVRSILVAWVAFVKGADASKFVDDCCAKPTS